MRMSSQDSVDYPKTSHYVRVDLIEVLTMPRILGAMRRIGQLNEGAFRTALTWGHGPRIKITHLHKAYGEFTQNIGSHELRLDRRTLVDEFEAGRGWARMRNGQHFPMLGATLLHELTHWGDDQDGVTEPDREEGEEFEIAFFGKVMTPCKKCARNQKRIRRNTRHSVGWL
jgi:hypothetical protein